VQEESSLDFLILEVCYEGMKDCDVALYVVLRL
jgi:hypothetical protein